MDVKPIHNTHMTKLYILTIDEVCDYVDQSYKPEVYLTKKEAVAAFKDYKKEAQKDYKDILDSEYVQEGYDNKDALHFECYRDGYYAQDHYSVTVHTIEVSGLKKVA